MVIISFVMDKKVYITINNMKKSQRDVLKSAADHGRLTYSLVSNASGFNKPIEFAGQISTAIRMKEEDKTSLFVQSGFDIDTGKPNFVFNPKAKTKQQEIKELIESLNELDKKFNKN